MSAGHRGKQQWPREPAANGIVGFGLKVQLVGDQGVSSSLSKK